MMEYIPAELFKQIAGTIPEKLQMRIWRKGQILSRQLTTVTELLLANIAL